MQQLLKVTYFCYLWEKEDGDDDHDDDYEEETAQKKCTCLGNNMKVPSFRLRLLFNKKIIIHAINMNTI